MTSERYYASSKFYDLTATIAVGQTKSAIINLNGLELVGMFIPANFDGTLLGIDAATAIDATPVTVQDGTGVDLALTVAPSRYVPLPNLAISAGIQFLRLSATTAQSGTDTVITLAVRSV